MHPTEVLWSRHHPQSGYPIGVIPVPELIAGTAFFPGGYGLWRPDILAPLPEFPSGRTMIVGHDFHSEDGYRESLRQTRESESQPTWRVLLRLLDRVGISPDTCFFTNAYMGLRAGAGTTGPFPGATSPEFVAHCTRFLGEQIATQRPSLIITLGINVPPIIGSLFPGLQNWTGTRGLKHLDRVGAVQRNVQFGADPTLRSTVVALTHPSMRHASVRHRAYGDQHGDAAEIQVLRDALASVAPAS